MSSWKITGRKHKAFLRAKNRPVWAGSLRADIRLTNIAFVLNETDLIFQPVSDFRRFRRKIPAVLRIELRQLLLQPMQVLAGIGAVVVAFQPIQQDRNTLSIMVRTLLFVEGVPFILLCERKQAGLYAAFSP